MSPVCIALLVLGVLFVAWLVVILVRAANFKPKDEPVPVDDPVEADRDHAIESLRQMVRCKTVSYYDEAKIDEAEFDKFRALLPERFPTVFEKCAYERIGKSGLLFTLKGRSSEKPSVFMAHYDVVPVNERQWQKPAFEGIIEDDVLWGRGTLDTKGTLNGVLEAAETLLKQGFVPENDMYFAFAGDEEIAGVTQTQIVETLRARGIRPAFVLDEGGAVVENVFPGVKGRCALIGTGEKGILNLSMSIEGAGGHASAPPAHTAVGKLAKAVVTIEDHPFRFRITAPVAGMFDTLGRHSTFVYRLIFANLWCFKPVLNGICKKSGGELNALVRTTCAMTQMSGSPATNVLAPNASIGANFRIMGGETPETVIARCKKLVNNDEIVFRNEQSQSPSPFSRTDCEAWNKLTEAVRSTWPDALVSPYLMIACSDSRHYCAISDNVYRFSMMELSKEQRGMIHGTDERIPFDTIVKTVECYMRVMKKL